jgi:hypothetical protein
MIGSEILKSKMKKPKMIIIDLYNNGKMAQIKEANIEKHSALRGHSNNT